MKILIQNPAGISFMDILLDERICQGTIAVPWGLVLQAGGYNQRLKAKQKYELILRIAKECPISFEEREVNLQSEKYMILQECESFTDADNGWKTDCYVLGKYSSELRQSGFFDQAVSCMLESAEAEGRVQQTVAYLEEMVGRGEKYDWIDDAARPILIYKGDHVCHNVLTVMAEQFGNAIQQLGIPVIYFDCGEEELEEITKYMHHRFRAIVGVQSYLFSIKQEDGVHYLHDCIYGPKYNFVFDHPLWFQNHLTHRLEDFHILTNDYHYKIFFERFYKKDAVFFPPAGMMLDVDMKQERIYDLTFIGECGNYFNEVILIHQMERKKRFLANHFLLFMKKNPGLTSEEAFRQTLSRKKIVVTDKEFLELFYEMRRVIYCIMSYYRVKVLRTILDAGIQLHVFGSSWDQSPLKKQYTNLICHPDVSVKESVRIWQQSKLSLNVMSWHKAGFTERMAGIMLAGAVLVTDDTAYLRGNYDGEDILSFHLDRLQELPEQIFELLAYEKKRLKMAERGRKKTLKEHTWKKRAEQFIKLLEKDSKIKNIV